MEVSGQIAGNPKTKSKLYCLPCNRDDLKEQAYGYCKDCEEHLCETCYKHHRKPRPSRNHVLLGKDEMPKQQKTGNMKSDQTTDICTKHSNTSLEFYCYTHDSVECYVCVSSNHKDCKVDYIPGVSGNVPEELEHLFDRMEELIKKCKSNVKTATTSTVESNKMYRKAVKDMQIFRKEINGCLDRMEAEIRREAKCLLLKEKCKQDNLKSGSLRIAEEVSTAMSMLKSLNDDDKHYKLFIEMKSVGPQVLRLSEKEKRMVKDNETNGSVIFIRNQRIIDQLKNENTFGTITTDSGSSVDSAPYAKYERTLQVQSSSDKEPCDILGMVMHSTTHLIVADCGNNNVKMMDIETGTLVSEIALSSAPQDMIKLPGQKLAVALPDEKNIQIISYTDTSLCLDRRIDIGESCNCVAYCQDKLVVGCNVNPEKLVILDFDGNITQVFDTPGLFGGPAKIVISSDEKFMFISDFNFSSWKSKCIKMDWQGNIVQTFEHQGYESPLGIQELKEGTLLVCYTYSHNIAKLSSSFTKYDMVRLEKTEMHYPRALAYSDRDERLFISCSSGQGIIFPSDIIKTFIIE